jgi:hypothetical protein
MDINRLLSRNIKTGYEYEGLIPKYAGVSHNFDSGSLNSDTFDTLKFMAIWVEKYHNQMSRIAPKLKGATIEKTVKNIYNFLYWHFQYKLDDDVQQLYSPSAAWHFRKTGFDCKTFSILASCILTELGIAHSFRKVQQPGLMPGEWSHVYVIVHDKNKDYVIDATNHTNTEVFYTKKFDMSLKHRGLAGGYPIVNVGMRSFDGLGNSKFNGLGCGTNVNCGCNQKGLGLDLSSLDLGQLKDLVNIDQIKNLFSNISCIGGTAYDKSLLEGNVTLMNDLFLRFKNQINNSKNQNNLNELAINVAKFTANINLIIETYTKKRASKSWNSCSKANFDATLKAAQFFKIASTALQGWLQTYYNVGSVKQTLTVTNEGWEVLPNWWGMHITPWIVVNQPVYNLTPKADAPNFEFTQYILEATNSNSFNLSSFLQTLGNVAAVIDPQTGLPTTGSPTGSGINNSTTSSGISSTMMGTGAVIVIAGLLFWPSIKKLTTSKP